MSKTGKRTDERGFKPILTCRHAGQGMCKGCPVRIAREAPVKATKG